MRHKEENGQKQVTCSQAVNITCFCALLIAHAMTVWIPAIQTNIGEKKISDEAIKLYSNANVLFIVSI